MENAGAHAAESAQERDALLDEFPQYFARTARIAVPKGWRKFVASALKALGASGLTTTIDSLAIVGNSLDAMFRDKYASGSILLASLFCETSGLCVICGMRTTTFDDRAQSAFAPKRDKPAQIPICYGCRKKLGLFGEEPKKEPRARDYGEMEEQDGQEDSLY